MASGRESSSDRKGLDRPNNSHMFYDDPEHARTSLDPRLGAHEGRCSGKGGARRTILDRRNSVLKILLNFNINLASHKITKNIIKPVKKVIYDFLGEQIQVFFFIFLFS